MGSRLARVTLNFWLIVFISDFFLSFSDIGRAWSQISHLFNFLGQIDLTWKSRRLEPRKPGYPGETTGLIKDMAKKCTYVARKHANCRKTSPKIVMDTEC